MSESIYNLVPVEYPVIAKQSMYRSIHDPNGPLTGSTFGCLGTTRLLGASTVVKKDGALFGPPNEKYNLRKTLDTSKSVKQKADSWTGYTDKRKDPTPTVDDKPIIGIRSNKNFIVANAVETILQAPKPIKSNDLDYTKKEDFGKTPAYLTKVKEEIQREKEMIDTYIKEQLGTTDEMPDQIEELSEYERQDLIFALKKKWENVNSKFQKMSHHVIIDTEGQVRRKEKLEKELIQLEADIERLDRNGPIIVRK